MYETLEIGDPYLRALGKPDGIYFDIQYPRIELLYNMHRPTEKELGQFKSDTAFEIRAVELNDIIIITSKVGSLPWCDAPYNPRIGDCRLDDVEQGTQGYALQLLLTDAPEATLKHIRLIGLGNEFSRKFRALVLWNKGKPISEEAYDRNLQEVFRKYQTTQIADYSNIRYKYRTL